MEHSAMSETPSYIQGIRSVSKYSRNTLTTPDPADVVYVDVYTDPDSSKLCVLWDDIRQVFDDALHVRHQARALPFLRGRDLNTLKPFRIAAMPDVILDVFVSGGASSADSFDAQSSQQPSMLRQIELQAARYSKYDPFTTLRSYPSTRTSLLYLASQTSAPNNFDRIPNNGLSISLTHERAREALTRMTVHLDLRALHSKGDGPAQDFTKALECYLKNRQQGGHANALFCVGELFLNGRGGVSRDSAVAAKWFLKASNEGHDFCQVKKTMKKIAACVDLNALHNQGDGPPEDFPKALECYLKNLPEGQAHAFFCVGQLFFKGRGVSRNMSVAGNWFLEAANQGHALAQSNIGVMYELGRGVPRDSSRAMEWYLQAAKGGHVESKARYEFLTQALCKT